MNAILTTDLTARFATSKGMEMAICPRCGSPEGSTITEGSDYLHGLEGRFYVWQCANCHLQYQNPRPTMDRLSQLYPALYGPHRGRPSLNTVSTRSIGWRERLNRHPLGKYICVMLRAARARLRSIDRKTGLGFFRPNPAEMEVFLTGEMGHTHLRSLESSTERSLPLRTIRECRRLAGIELIPHYVAHGRLLEIGCATGDRMQTYRKRGWIYLDGIELTEQAAAKAQQRGFSVACEPVETALAKFSDSSFDVVVSSMVLEHLHNPFSVVQAISRVLKPGGEFLFSTVTRDSLDARLFGRYWSGYDFPRHMVYFRMKDIQDMLAQDFDLIECFHQNAPIDFLRPARWRKAEGRLSDRMIAFLAKSSVGSLLGDLLARNCQTCRISFRCRKKS